MNRSRLRIPTWLNLGSLLAFGCAGGHSTDDLAASSRTVCTSATIALTPVVPGTDQQLGKEFSLSSTAGGCVSQRPEYRLDHLRPGSGTWQIDRDWGPSNTWLWNTANADNGGLERPGHHEFRVLVREDGEASEAYVNGWYYLLPPPCHGGGSAEPNPASRLGRVGQTIMFANAAPGCADPEFRIDHLRPGESTWKTESAYSTANHWWWWNTQRSNDGNPEPPGYHYFQVLIRARASDAIYESYFTVEYYLQNETCDEVTSAPTYEWAIVGSKITINSATATCWNANFLIAHLRPGSATWQTDSAYSAANASYDWFTAVSNGGSAEPAGMHFFQILARAPSSSKSYESYASIAVELTAQESDGFTTATSPASPQSTGTQVTFISSSVKYPNPEYAVMHFRPDGSPPERREYSPANASWQWDTSNELPGVHRFRVGVRPIGLTIGDAGYAEFYYTLYPQGSDICESSSSARCAQSVSSRGPTEADSFDRTSWVFNGNGYLVQQQPEPRVYVESAFAKVPELDDVKSMTSGSLHFCALAGTSVYCWGANGHGQVGDGSVTDRASPTLVLTPAAGVTSGPNHNCAIVRGAAYCWGVNEHGEIGDGSTDDRWMPTGVANLPAEVTAVSAGERHSCAISGGAVYCWGDNTWGQLGRGDEPGSASAAPVHGLVPGATAVAAGVRFTCAIVDGDVWCWGSNHTGALGNGTANDSRVPVRVGGNAVRQASRIAVGVGHACASTPNGIYCWGSNTWYQLGDGTWFDNYLPVRVLGMNRPATSLTAGVANSCAIVSGIAYCWGSNRSYESGPDAPLFFNTPAQIATPP